MRPRVSGTGYLAFVDGPVFPVTSVQVREGGIWLESVVLWERGDPTEWAGGPVRVLGVDGERMLRTIGSAPDQRGVIPGDRFSLTLKIEEPPL